MSFGDFKLDFKSVSQTFRLALLLIILVEALSFWGFLFPVFSSVAMVTTCLVVLVLAFIRYDLAILVFLTELFIGSQGGYLFSFGLEGGLNLSLRMGLFLVIFGVWAIKTILSLIRHESLDWLKIMRKTGILWPYLALLVVFAFAGVRGLLANGFADVFFDANGYAFFGILPAVIAGFNKVNFNRFTGVIIAAVSASVLKALFVFYVFSHRIQVAASPIYTWIRDTRVGEITIQTGDFYRIFFQAHLFGLLLVVIGAVLAAYALNWRSARYGKILALVSWLATALVLGLSRSFWFGLFFGALTLIIVMVWSKANADIWKRIISLGFLSVIISVVLIMGTYAIPFPQKGSGFSFSDLLGDRVTSLDDDAAVSRWALLPLLNEAALKHPVFGSGFGTRVEYKTSDPRLLADIPDGIYSTFAFEWGYHDLWLKIGLLGVGIYGWLLYVLIRPLIIIIRRSKSVFRSAEVAKDNLSAIISLGVLAAFVAFMATNVFSPYLNHPLGIGTLALLAGWNGRQAK